MNHKKLILFAEDNVRDRADIARIFEESETSTQLRFVEDGRDLMNYLCKRKGYTAENAPPPDLSVFDINMPDKDSFKALEKIKKILCLSRKPLLCLPKDLHIAISSHRPTWEQRFPGKHHGVMKGIDTLNSFKIF